MIGRRTEMPHNSPEQVDEYLSQALAAVERLNPPDDLRVVFFQLACNLFSAKSIGVEQVQPGIPNMMIPRGPGL